MLNYKQLFENNKLWVASKKSGNESFFEELSQTHQPDYLLFACCDSRVAPLQMIGAEPGQVFIHRNIGNIVNQEDSNGMAALEYGINHLKVKHVIICGHYNCGAVLTAANTSNVPIIDPWIQPIRDLISIKQDELQLVKDEYSRHQLLVNLHVKKQCENLINSPSYKKALESDCAPEIHGWIFDLANGKLIDLDF